MVPTMISTSQERSCSICRHWILAPNAALGECRRGWPLPNGTHRAIWPLTAPTDMCGYFLAPLGSGNQAKITDGEILEMVRAGNYNGLPMKRAWLVTELKDSKGLAKTSALERVARLVREGKLTQGLVVPPKMPRWNIEHPALWIPGSPPDGAVDGDAATVAQDDEPRAPGRPAYEPESFMAALREVAPSESRAVIRADIVRAMRKIVPTLGDGTASRLIAAMVESGQLASDNGQFWAPAPSVDVD